MTLTIAIIRAAAWDAGNRSMRRARRLAWAADDWDAACAELDRLLGCLDGPATGEG